MNTLMNAATFGLTVYHASRAMLQANAHFEEIQYKVPADLTNRVPGLRRYIKLIIADRPCSPSFFGTNNFNGAAVQIPSGMIVGDTAGTNYFLLRQLYHIKNNTGLKSEVEKSIATFAAAILGLIVNKLYEVPRSFPVLVAESLTLALDHTRDVAARNFALKTSTDDELKGALKIFKSCHYLSDESEFIEKELKDRNIKSR